MTDDKHSPEPWRLGNRKGIWNGAPINDANGVRICNLSRKADRPTSQKEANARLIAQAWTIPALRTAVNGLLEIAEEAMPSSFFQSDSRVVAAHAALALAQEKE